MSGFSSLTAKLKILSDPGRVRLLSILDGVELTVTELTEVLGIGQSTVSSQLSQLREQGLVGARKEGQFVFYRALRPKTDSVEAKILKSLRELSTQTEWHRLDRRNLERVMERRREASLSYFRDQNAQNGRSPGKGWESLATGFLLTIRDKDIVDLGCGNGRLSAMLARNGNRVVGVDHSPEQIRLARELHQAGKSPQFHQALMENTGLEAKSFDLAIISHALHHVPQPREALAETRRILRPGGQVLILDLASHQESWVSDRFGDFWLGFPEDTLRDWLEELGFLDIQFAAAGRDLEYPAIESLVVSAMNG